MLLVPTPDCLRASCSRLGVQASLSLCSLRQLLATVGHCLARRSPHIDIGIHGGPAHACGRRDACGSDLRCRSCRGSAALLGSAFPWSPLGTRRGWWARQGVCGRIITGTGEAERSHTGSIQHLRAELCVNALESFRPTRGRGGDGGAFPGGSDRSSAKLVAGQPSPPHRRW